MPQKSFNAGDIILGKDGQLRRIKSVGPKSVTLQHRDENGWETRGFRHDRDILDSYIVISETTADLYVSMVKDLMTKHSITHMDAKKALARGIMNARSRVMNVD